MLKTPRIVRNGFEWRVEFGLMRARTLTEARRIINNLRWRDRTNRQPLFQNYRFLMEKNEWQTKP